MLELSQEGSCWRLGHGGDTLNTAVHCARLGLSSACLTALGDDPFSKDMRRQLEDEGLDTSLFLVDGARPTGLYAIATDEKGERSFTYWRRQSAASAMAAHKAFGAAAERCLGATLFYFSLISLAVLPEADRTVLLDLASRIKDAGGLVAFDGNYRARLWDEPKTALHWRSAAASLSDFGFPSFDDERLLGGFASADAVAKDWRRAGAKEVVVKLGALGCLANDGDIVAPNQAIEAIDTSGAGDAFNAGYLAARLRGEPEQVAAARGNRLAGWVVGRRGALPPVDALAPYPAFAGASQHGA